MKKIVYIMTIVLLSFLLVSCGETYNLTFDLNGGTGNIETITVKKGKKANEPVEPTIENGGFSYWSYDEDQVFSFDTKIERDYHLKAVYAFDEVEVKYTVNFDLNYDGSESLDNLTVLENKTITLPKVTREGYKFIGWYLDDVEFLETTKVTKDITLIAKWEILQQFSVTFVLNNGSDDVVREFYEDSLILAPSNLTNDDLSLVGWYLDHEFQEGYWNLANDLLEEDITLYARWAETFTEKTTQEMENGNFDNDESINNASNMGLEPSYFNVKAIKGNSTLPGYFSNEIRLYVGAALEFELHESFVISKIKVKFGYFNAKPGKTRLTFGTDYVDLENHNNETFVYDNLHTNYFKVHNRATATADRVYIDYIEITYFQVGPDVEREDDINRPVIDISEHQLIELELGDIFDPRDLEFIAEDVEDINVDVLYDRDTININKYGIYYAFYYAIDSDENRTDVYITVIVREVNQILNYYNSINSESEGETLKEELRTLLEDTLSLVNYELGNLSMEISDRDPNNFNNVWLIYNSASVRGGWNATNWAKEHTWAKSAFGSDTNGVVYSISATPNGYRGIGSDLHNLRTINPSVNSSHSNYEFGDDNGRVSGQWQRLTLSSRPHNPYTPGKENDTTTSVFYPGEEHIGDVARILLYMNTLWDIITREDIDMLIRWHLDDPVDNFEIIRNEVIYSYQGNRNPYIDYPELLELVYAN